MPSLLTRLVRALRYRFITAPRGGGKPVPPDALDAEYRSGHWDHFFGPDEQQRHEAIVRLIFEAHPQPRLLDLGCGSGRLASLLPPEKLRAYLGADLSTEGLNRARSLNLPHGRFVQGNFETWRPDPSTPWDLITFNECIGYAKDPAATATAFAAFLAPGGAVIVSHFRWGNHAAVWRRLAENFSFTRETSVQNAKGQIWDLKVLRPRSAASAPSAPGVSTPSA